MVYLPIYMDACMFMVLNVGVIHWSYGKRDSFEQNTLTRRFFLICISTEQSHTCSEKTNTISNQLISSQIDIFSGLAVVLIKQLLY